MAEALQIPIERGIEADPTTTTTTTTTTATTTEDLLNPFFTRNQTQPNNQTSTTDKKLYNDTHLSLPQPKRDEEKAENSTKPEILWNHNHFGLSEATQPPEDQQATIEGVLTCGVCLRAYDSEYRRPILLPNCGHTFCRTCVKNLDLKDAYLCCPFCRKEYRNQEVDNFPINFSLQIVASIGKMKIKAADPSECPTHGVRYAFWCRRCEVPACGECLYEGHPRDTHPLCRLEDALGEISARTETLLRDAHEEAKSQLVGSLARVLQGISDMQEASHILQELTRIPRRVVGPSTQTAITSLFETAKGVNRKVMALKDGGGGSGGGGSGGAGGGGGAAAGGGDGGGESTLSSLRAGVSGRPVVVALSETGGLAQVVVEEMGVHIYSIRPASAAYSVAVKLSLLLTCLPTKYPRVFLDLKAGERKLGRVYIKLWGEMRRAQQFLALCLGNLGPCYRDSRFDGVHGRGEPGEYVRGGAYMGEKGLTGEALMDGLEWGGRWEKPIQAGQVCGVGGEEKHKYGALYAICLRDNPDSTFRAPFGMVTSGMEVIEVACRHNPFNMVRVADCGVVLEL